MVDSNYVLCLCIYLMFKCFVVENWRKLFPWPPKWNHFVSFFVCISVEKNGNIATRGKISIWVLDPFLFSVFQRLARLAFSYLAEPYFSSILCMLVYTTLLLENGCGLFPAVSKRKDGNWNWAATPVLRGSGSLCLRPTSRKWSTVLQSKMQSMQKLIVCFTGLRIPITLTELWVFLVLVF